MTKPFVFKMNRAGVGELLRSGAVEADLRARAERVASAAGAGMEADSMVGARRARAGVITATFDARLAEAKDKRLTRAFGAAK